MTLRQLVVGYLAVGVATAAWLYARERRGGGQASATALLCVPLWPLWLPVALSSEASDQGPLAERVRAAKELLAETACACAQAGLARLFSADAARALGAGLDRALERVARMDRLLATPSFDPRRASERLARHEAEGAGRAADLARAQVEHAGRLREARAREARSLEEVVELVRSLRSQVMLVELSGGAPERAGDLSDEIRARLEALTFALGPEAGDGASGSV